eukprot:1891924-Alexandrium_andersonii.AAC.1
MVRCVNKSDYSPAQIALGRQPRRPWSLLGKPARAALAEHDLADGDLFARRVAAQAVARQALLSLDT